MNDKFMILLSPFSFSVFFFFHTYMYVYVARIPVVPIPDPETGPDECEHRVNAETYRP